MEFEKDRGIVMSGHSKWNNIKRKKEKTDSQKAKIFTKIGREMAIVVRQGGPDPAANAKLRDCIAKAKANNVPNDNIDRIIKKAAGEQDGKTYEELTYEGYGPQGIAVVVEALTDNRNRTAGDLRHYFDKNGGNLGQNGSVMFLFNRMGVLLVEAGAQSEEQIMEDALEAGAEDFNAQDGGFEITTDPNEFSTVRDALENKGYTFASAQIEYVPTTTTALNDEESIFKMNRLIEMLEENDDIQAVWHNWENPEDGE